MLRNAIKSLKLYLHQGLVGIFLFHLTLSWFGDWNDWNIRSKLPPCVVHTKTVDKRYDGVNLTLCWTVHIEWFSKLHKTVWAAWGNLGIFDSAQNLGHSGEFLTDIFQDIWEKKLCKFWEFCSAWKLLGRLYMLKKNSLLLKNLGTWKIPMLEKIWENFFPGCLKKFMQFWKLRLAMKIIKVENKIISGQKVWALWENPDSQ